MIAKKKSESLFKSNDLIKSSLIWFILEDYRARFLSYINRKTIYI